MSKSQFKRRSQMVGGLRGDEGRRRGRAVLQVVAMGLAAGVLAVAGRPTQASTYYWLGGISGNGTWDNNATNLYWDSGQTTHHPLGWTLLGPANDGTAVDAQFLGTGKTTVTMDDAVNPVVVNSITVGPVNSGGTTTFGGTAASIVFASGYLGGVPTAPNATTGQLVFTQPLQSAAFQQTVSTGSGQFVIVGDQQNYLEQGAASGVGVTLGANTNTFGGGVKITTGPIDFFITNNAASNTQNPAAYVTNGVTYGGVLVTAISGTVAGTYPTITIDADGSGVTMAGTKTGAQNVLVNDFINPNPIVLNPSGAPAFAVALGAGSVGNTGIPSGGGASYNAATKQVTTYFSSQNFTGQISGSGDILIANDFWGGGGKGITIFSNPNNNYTGRTIVSNNGPTYQTFVVGGGIVGGQNVAQNLAAGTGVIPPRSDLSFGGASIGVRLGDAAKLGNKAVGAIDLNGYDITVHSLSTDLINPLTVLGVTATNNAITNHNILTGPNSATTKLSTLTIDSAGDTVNTTFAGNIWDGGAFMAAANTDTGAYGNSNGNVHYYVNWGSDAALAVGLTLAGTNKGSLTISQFFGSTTTNATLTYSGPTTINGGTLYMNGTLTGSTVTGTITTGSTVTVQTTGANQAVLGGYGTISTTGGVTVKTNSVITPSYQLYAAPFSGSLNQVGTATASTLTVNKLTMDAGSSIGILLNDGSATPGSGGWSQLNVTGTFTKSASVVIGSPILIDASGPMTGFNNSATTSWPIATLPGLLDSDIATATALIAIDPANTTTNPMTNPILGGGTFALSHAGNTLNLVFTPSASAVNLLWTGASGTAWDVGNTVAWADTNHTNNPSVFTSDRNVNFGNGAAAITVNIQHNIILGVDQGVSPSGVYFANTAATTYHLQGGPISGGATLALTGTGIVQLASPNTYSGGTLILNGGTVETQTSGALGSNMITIYKGTWSVTTTDQTYSNTVSVAAVAPATAGISTTHNLILSGSIVGSGNFTKSGAGALTVSGSIGQAGNLAVTQGALIVNGTATYGGATTVAAGASITVNQPAGTIFSLQPTTALAGSITFNNLVNLSLATGTFSGGGTITLAADQSSVQGQGSTVTYSNAIAMNPNNLPTFGAVFGMASTVATITFSGKISGNGDVYFGAGVGGGGGATIYVGNTPAVPVLDTYTGKTYIATGGTAILFLQNSLVLPSTTVLTFGYNHSGAGYVDLNATTQTIANLDCDSTGGGLGGLNSSSGQATLNLTGSVSGKFNAIIEGFINLNVKLTNNAVLDLQYNGFNGTDTNTYGNTYSGVTTISSGVLRVTDPLAFSPSTNILINGLLADAVLENGGTFATFNEKLGNDSNAVTGGLGNGELQVLAGTSGFSAHTLPLTVNLVANTGGSTLVWGSTYFKPTILLLNETTADTTLNFQNNIDLAGAARTVTVNTLGAATAATISGNITSIGGSLIKIGTGTLILSGANTYGGGTTVNGGVLQFASAAAIPSSGKVAINAGGAVAVTGAYTTVAGWLNSGVITTTSAGALALTADSNEAIDLTTAGGGAYTNISLGATGSVTFSGSITPLAQTYRLGGGGGTLTVSTALGDSGGTTGLAISGPGKVIFTNANTFTGNTSIAAGATLQLGDGSTASGSIGGNVAMGTGGTLAFANPTAQAFTGGISGAGSVTKTGAGALSLTGTAATLSYTGATVVNQGILTLNTAGFIPGSVLDINKGGSPKTGAIVIVKGGAANISALASAISTGYAGGAWNAAGGISSTSASVNNNQGIGYLTGAQYNTLNPGNTLGLAAGDAMLKYTWRGDINLDGTVDLRDLQLLDAAYVSGGVGMGAVDSNYDGVINAADFATAYTSLTNEGNTVLANQLYPVFASEFGGAFTGAVPEPASLGLLGLGGLLALRRRR